MCVLLPFNDETLFKGFTLESCYSPSSWRCCCAIRYFRNVALASGRKWQQVARCALFNTVTLCHNFPLTISFSLMIKISFSKGCLIQRNDYHKALKITEHCIVGDEQITFSTVILMLKYMFNI